MQSASAVPQAYPFPSLYGAPPFPSSWQTFVEQPPLSKSDGPVAVYRRYVKQFYPPIAGAGDRQAVDEAAGQATS